MRTAAELARHLATASERRPAGRVTFDWPDHLDPQGEWFLPESLISLHGTAAWDALDGAQRRRLSFHELVNFFSQVLSGERVLLERMTPLLYKPGYLDTTEYLHHFVEEENRHMLWFGTFCRRYAGKVYPSQYYPVPAKRAEGEDAFHFWVSVLAFEEMGDVYNVRIAAAEEVVPIVRAINRQHHQEESRHLAFGRQMTREVWERYSPEWPAEVTARVREYVRGYLIAQFFDLFRVAVYRDAGIPDPYDTRAAALRSAAANQRFHDVTDGCGRLLCSIGVLDALPDLPAD